MTFIARSFSNKQVETLNSGIQSFITLTALSQDQRHSKWTMDEFDLLDKIESVKMIVQSMSNYSLKNMYRKTPYSLLSDIKRETQEVFFLGKTKEQKIIQHKYFGIMFNTVFEPIFNMMSTIKNAEVPSVMLQVLDDLEYIVKNQDFDIGDLEQAREIQASFAAKFKNTHRRAYEESSLEIISQQVEHESMELNFH